jgi:hypothetical protein
MKTILSTILLSTLAFTLFSQDDNKGTIDAQRPTRTESYSIIVPNVIQFENGLDFDGGSETISYGTFVRGSVTKRVELRASTDYEDKYGWR